MLMACKNNDTSSARLILDELKSKSPNSMGCARVSLRYSNSQRVGDEVVPTKRRYTFLLLKAMEHSRENVGTATKYANSKPRDA